MPEYRFLSTCHGPLIAADTSSNTARSAGPSGFRRPEPSWMMPIDVEKPSSARALVDRPRVLGVLDAAAEHRVDVDVEVGVVAQPLQLLVEQPQALLRDLVRLDVVDADLQEVEARPRSAPRSASAQEVAVGDEPGHHAAAADARG